MCSRIRPPYHTFNIRSPNPNPGRQPGGFAGDNYLKINEATTAHADCFNA